MDLSLKRFEIFIVFLVALFVLAAVAVFFFLPGGDAKVRSILLLPQPVVINEKEAILRQVSESSAQPVASLTQRAQTLDSLSATAATTGAPNVEVRLRILEQLSKQD